MNRDLDATAAVLGIGPRILRRRLRELGILQQNGELACAHRDKGYLFVETRSRWNPSIGAWSHYPVVMTTEAGIAWLATKLDITVTQKGAAA